MEPQFPNQYFRIFIFALSMSLFSMSVAAERVALIIGNSGYEGRAKLLNPKNDAEAVEGALESLDFDVDIILDANRQKMNRAIGKFIDRLKSGSVGLFYFAGHGFQVDGANYLLPVESVADNLYNAKNNSIAVNQVFEAFRSANSDVNVLILDCCRDNPFSEEAVSRSIRSLSRGLADVAPPRGTIVAFSTASGLTAADGSSGSVENSPFTSVLADELAQRPSKGLLLSSVLRATQKRVFAETGQDPILNIPGSADEVVLAKGVGNETVPGTNPGSSESLAKLMAEIERIKDQIGQPATPSVSIKPDLEAQKKLEEKETEIEALKNQIALIQSKMEEKPEIPIQRSFLPERWDHNGSTMALVQEGDQITISYSSPRSGLPSYVKKGTILFEGTVVNEAILGKARRFKSGLDPIRYDVKGKISNGNKIFLETNSAPKRNSSGRIISYSYEGLSFSRK